MGGGGGQTTTTEIPGELKPLASAYTEKALGLGQQQFQPYTEQRFEGFNPAQQTALGMIGQRALSGDALQNQSYQYLGNMLSSSPQEATRSPYSGQGVSEQDNPFLQSNPYLEQNIDATLGDVARNYNLNVRPSQVTGAVSSGSFGNSGIAEMAAAQDVDLQRQMGNIASGMRMQDFATRQQLAESDVNRNLQAQQFNAQMGAQAGQDWASRNDAMLNAQRQANLSALGMTPQFSNAQYQDAAQLMQAGQLAQNQNQQNRDFSYQQFQEQQNLPYKQLAAMGAPFGSGLGQIQTSTGGGK